MTRETAHPGEVLKADFLGPLGISANALATALDVPANQIADIIEERKSITADIALRLSQQFGFSAEFWLGLQADCDASE